MPSSFLSIRAEETDHARLVLTASLSLSSTVALHLGEFARQQDCAKPNKMPGSSRMPVSLRDGFSGVKKSRANPLSAVNIEL